VEAVWAAAATARQRAQTAGATLGSINRDRTIPGRAVFNFAMTQSPPMYKIITVSP